MEETVFARMMRWSKDRSWNQSDVATRLDVLPQHVSNWKRRGVPPERLADIARLFGRTIEELLGLTEEEAGKRSRPWPFDGVDEAKVYDLSEDDRLRLETAVLIAAGQVGLDVKKD